jgi:2-keto-4-pentenoate hydratase/2-oxohepta-3-ene-1,7-dioic acid hydratase in catechol pathway
MKLLNYYKDHRTKLGIKTNQGIIDVEKVAEQHDLNIPTTMDQVINGGSEAIDALKKLEDMDHTLVNEEDITYAPAVTNPEKIICVGLNYEKHAKETNQAIPEVPILFSKFNNALAAHQESIQIPEADHRIDYEAELVIVIGKEASNITTEEALSYVFGYTVGNDVSARKLQSISRQWLLGKTLDGFAPIGPYIVTADAIDPQNLEISCRVNGEVRQSSNTNDMIFDCGEIISYASKHMTLKPGDVIFTGTPEGVIVGQPRGERKWLKSGDRMEVSIEDIGDLINVLE